MIIWEQAKIRQWTTEKRLKQYFFDGISLLNKFTTCSVTTLRLVVITFNGFFKMSVLGVEICGQRGEYFTSQLHLRQQVQQKITSKLFLIQRQIAINVNSISYPSHVSEVCPLSYGRRDEVNKGQRRIMTSKAKFIGLSNQPIVDTWHERCEAWHLRVMSGIILKSCIWHPVEQEPQLWHMPESCKAVGDSPVWLGGVQLFTIFYLEKTLLVPPPLSVLTWMQSISAEANAWDHRRRGSLLFKYVISLQVGNLQRVAGDASVGELGGQENSINRGERRKIIADLFRGMLSLCMMSAHDLSFQRACDSWHHALLMLPSACKWTSLIWGDILPFGKIFSSNVLTWKFPSEVE